jgi:WD40 repeat protein
MATIATYDLFISYVDADRAWVEGYLLDALERAGLRCHSEAAFEIGVPRLTSIERAVRGSRYTLLIVSAAYQADSFALFANLLAQQFGVENQTWPVIPLILDNSIKLPGRLAMLKALDASDPARWPDVLKHLYALMQIAPPPAPASPKCPYPGLVPFDRKDAQLFHGRDAEIDSMIQRLRYQRLLFVIGPSGSGKSSLISAGLLPSLMQSDLFAPGSWHVRGLRPTNQTIRSFAATTPAGEALPARVIAKMLADNPPAQRVLLVIDQFEELFTQLEHAEQGRFIAALNTLRKVKSCTLLIAMRADFYPDLMNSELWPIDTSQRLEIAPLRGNELRRAIEQPANDAGVYLEDRLLERLLADAADEPGVLPLVQETMRVLWSKMEGRLIPLHAYAQLGSEGRSGLAAAIATHADGALAELPEDRKEIARRILLRLVQFGEGRADTRRQQRLSDLRSVSDQPALFNQTLRHLVDYRLLTLSSPGLNPHTPTNGKDSGARSLNDRSTVFVDIAHEALITGWPTMRDLLAQQHEGELVRRRLEEQAAEWVRMGREQGGLLDNVELLEAERWMSSLTATEIGYSEALAALVHASVAERTRRIAEQARSTMRLRWLAVVLAIVAVVALGAAFFAFKQTRIALSRTLAWQASSLVDSQLDLAMLLSLAAYRTSNTFEARNSLIAASMHSPFLTTYLRQHRGEVTQVAFSPDGRLLASTGCHAFDAEQRCTGSELRLWDTVTRQLLAPLPNQAGMINAIAFSPDGQLLAVASCAAFDDAHRCTGGEIRLWNAVTRQVDKPLQDHGKGIIDVTFSANGTLLASVSVDGAIMLWDSATRQVIATLPTDPAHPASGIVFSPDGKLLASRGSDTTILLWDVASRRQIGQLAGHTDKVRSLAFSPDGRLLASGGWDKTILLCDVATQQLVGAQHAAHTGLITSLAFSPDGRLLASGSWDKTILLWDVATHRHVGPALIGHTELISTIAFDPTGRSLASGSQDTTIILWDIGGHRPLMGHPDSVEGVAFSASGNLLASVGCGLPSNSAPCPRGQVRLWNAASRQPLTAPLDVTHSNAKSVAFDPIGNLLAVGSDDGTITLWDASWQRIAELTRGKRPGVIALAFSPDGASLAAGSRDGALVLWNIATRQAHELPQEHTRSVESLAFNYDGTLLASGSSDKRVIIWDVAGQHVLRRLTQHIKSVYSVAFSPDGKLLASGSADQSVMLWDVSTGQRVGKPLRGHTQTVFSVAFSHDGAVLASGSGDHTIVLWDVAAQQQIGQPLRGHTGTVYSLAFSSDNANLASGSADGTVLLWDVRSLQEIEVGGWQKRICATVARDLISEEWKQYRGGMLNLERPDCTDAATDTAAAGSHT